VVGGEVEGSDGGIFEVTKGGGEVVRVGGEAVVGGDEEDGAGVELGGEVGEVPGGGVGVYASPCDTLATTHIPPRGPTMCPQTLRIPHLALVTTLLLAPTLHAQPKPWPIRAVIVTTFEIGADTGDIPGEFQLWVEREHLTETLPFPGGPIGPTGTPHPIRANPDHTILGIVSGTTLVNATASMMALGLDPRFDLTHTYILINGIAGVDPHIASIGSAAWATFVVNDVTRYIDPHDAPTDWPYGFFPSGAHAPNPPTLPPNAVFQSNLYPLNPKLAAWAFAQTKDLKLLDDPTVAAFRAGFTDLDPARRPPFVLLGDTFASDYYWHGATMTQFAEDWTRLWSNGKATFAMTEMEDAGFLNAIQRLDALHRLDANRVMVLRTGSNYSQPRPNHTAVESLTAPYIGTRLAVESAWLCGSTVLHELLTDWQVTRDHIPSN
jgi:purine nucleoside permease